MGATKAKLNYLVETKSVIKSALADKGVLVDDATPFREYANAIRNMPQDNGSGVTASGQWGDNVTWTVYDDGRFVVSGSGAMDDPPMSGAYYAPMVGECEWSPYREGVTSIIIEAGITVIGRAFFYGFSNAKIAIIPEGVTDINVRAFGECTNLSIVELPTTLTNIKGYVFFRCPSIKNITIPKSTTNIASTAFETCSSLKNVFYAGTKAEWDLIGINMTKLNNATLHCEYEEGGSSSGGGSGIIDVTELPTSGIDENAVYRLTESYKAFTDNVWLVMPMDEADTELLHVTLGEYFSSSVGISIPVNIYVVDELPADMQGSDFEYLTEFNLYVTRADGIAYMHVPAFEMTGSVGALFFEDASLDKGYTSDPYAETEIGVYTTAESDKQFEKFFMREDGEWKEITAHINSLSSDGCEKIETLAGVYDGGDITCTSAGVFDLASLIKNEKKIPLKINIDTPCIGDILCNELPEHIPMGWFKNKDGIYIDRLENTMFSGTSIVSIDMPDTIAVISLRAFRECTNLTLEKLPENLSWIRTEAFESCGYITITDIPAGVDSIESRAFASCTSLTTITFHSKPKLNHDIFDNCPNLTTINVPWSEDEVVAAPWGATNATINYNYTGG